MAIKRIMTDYSLWLQGTRKIIIGSFKQEQGKFNLDIKKDFLTIRVVKHWIRLPNEKLRNLCSWKL